MPIREGYLHDPSCTPSYRTTFHQGTGALQNVMNQWQWMPQVIILSYFCPKGMEATMYALLAGCHNLGNTIASSWGALLLETLEINPNGSTGESDQFTNLWKASLLASVLPLISVVALFHFIPDVKQGDRIVDPNASATRDSMWRRYWNLHDDWLPWWRRCKGKQLLRLALADSGNYQWCLKNILMDFPSWQKCGHKLFPSIFMVLLEKQLPTDNGPGDPRGNRANQSVQSGELKWIGSGWIPIWYNLYDNEMMETWLKLEDHVRHQWKYRKISSHWSCRGSSWSLGPGMQMRYRCKNRKELCGSVRWNLGNHATMSFGNPDRQARGRKHVCEHGLPPHWIWSYLIHAACKASHGNLFEQFQHLRIHWTFDIHRMVVNNRLTYSIIFA